MISLLIADSRKMVRDGIRTLVTRESDMNVVAEAVDGRTTVQRAGEYLPDAVVMDISMPDMSGLAMVRGILRASPETKVMILSLFNDRQLVSRLLEAGASAYILKDCACRELATGIRRCMCGGLYLSPGLLDMMFENPPAPHQQSGFSTP
ncbi:MAG: response regulator transcription factor [Deltaproteobacteria bacterium]|nr:response regulator transcription factor [Deltaproteobacteria bacterium]